MNSQVEGEILLVGDGDFSLTRSLLRMRYNSPHQITTTSLETEDTVHKHKDAIANRDSLLKLGVQVLFGVDACKLQSYEPFGAKTFKRIIFNFPHVGGKSNHKKNRTLLTDFFRSAVSVLHPQGHVIVTLCKGQGGTPADRPQRAWPDSWQVVSMAANAGLILSEIHPFHPGDFPGYFCTGFRSQDKWFHIDGAVTHVFTLSEPILVPTLSAVACPSADVYPNIFCRNLTQEAGHPLNKLREHLTDGLCSAWSTKVISPCNGEASIVKLKTEVIRELLSGPGRDLLPGQQVITSVAVKKEKTTEFESAPVHHVMIGLYRSDQKETDTTGKVFTEKLQLLLSKHCLDGQMHEKLQLVVKCSEENDRTDVTLQGLMSCQQIQIKGDNCEANCVSVYTCTNPAHQSEHSVLIYSLSLSTLLCCLCNIEDVRMLWSADSRFFAQFSGSDNVCMQTFTPFSLYPVTFSHDMSFWENPDLEFNQQLFYQIIRSWTRETIKDVTLLDKYTDSITGRVSRCYRLTFQSCDRALSYSVSWQLQSLVRLAVADQMNITLR